MIKLNNIGFSYEKTEVLKDFSLQISKKDRICLFGESGSGKTTILRLILGLETPLKGEIQKAENLKPAVVFQEDRLIPFKSVLENITLFGADEETALLYLERLGLKDYANKMPSDLSGGMSRRVALVRALSNQFDYLVLDEPFTGLDQENIDTAANLINEVLGEKPLILVTHSKAEAELLNCTFEELV
ncbi:MAG: ABC transporter ATP-binding protein [Clostridia bacterium]|nr:ABC transporter ATP-binding protein [Clostridia bacterium]